MYLSSNETFMIWLVIALITSFICIMRRGGDDDHDQGAGCGACSLIFKESSELFMDERCAKMYMAHNWIWKVLDSMW